MSCDTEEYDGVDQLPDGWEDIEEIQSYESATRSMDACEDGAYEWWTHIGWCPDCSRATRQRMLPLE